MILSAQRVRAHSGTEGINCYRYRQEHASRKADSTFDLPAPLGPASTVDAPSVRCTSRRER